MATIGELFLEIGDGATWDEGYRHGVRELLQARRQYPALCAGGSRTVLPAFGETSVYAFLREAEVNDTAMIVALNFSATMVDTAIDLDGRGLLLRDVRTGEQFVVMGELPVGLPGYGYALYIVEAEIARVG